MNKHNLTRDIPDPVKREVRQRCGFGCVVCGSAIYDYEHFDPEYIEAKEHNANGIALLCPTDHTRKRKNLLSHQKYLQAIANPKAKEINKAYTEWEVGDSAPTIIIGDKIFTGGTSIIKIDDELILGFKTPIEKGAPPRLYLRFFDREENEVFSIIDNEIGVNSDAFDIETEGSKWNIRSALYKTDLRIELSPPNLIFIKQINLTHKKWALKAKNEKFEILYDGNPSILFSGNARIEGECLYDLREEGKIESKNLNITFLAGGTVNKAFRWPLYLYVKTKNGVELGVIQNLNLLPLFTTEALAIENTSGLISDEYELKSLNRKGLIKILEKIAIPNGISNIVLDQNLKGEFHLISPIDLKQFIKDNSIDFGPYDLCPCNSGKLFKDCHMRK